VIAHLTDESLSSIQLPGFTGWVWSFAELCRLNTRTSDCWQLLHLCSSVPVGHPYSSNTQFYYSWLCAVSHLCSMVSCLSGASSIWQVRSAASVTSGSICCAGSPSDANAGLVHIQSSAKPLVPYPVGISVQPHSQDHRRSRFAEESHAASRAAMTPHPIRDVQNSPQV